MIRSMVCLALVSMIAAGGVEAQEQAAAGAVAWTTSCASSGRAVEPACEAEQRVVLSSTGQLLAGLTVRFASSSAEPELTVQLPHGLYLPSGVRLSAGEDQVLDMPLVTCDGNGCYALTGLDGSLLDRLRDAQELTVTFEDMSRAAISVPVAMVGFAEAIERAR